MAPKYLEKIAIVGAGGRIGTHITKSLLATGKHTVTAITRAESTSELPQDVVRADVDYNAEASLVKALQGQQCLIITLNRMAAPNTQSLLVQAAAKAGVPYIIPNLWGYDTRNAQIFKDLGPLANAFTSICQEIESLGVSKWIAVANGFWYEFSLGGTPDRFGFDFSQRTLDLIDDGTLKINTSTFAQVGRAVAALLSLDVQSDDDSAGAGAATAAATTTTTVSTWDNDVLFVSSFRVSQRDMYESVKRVTGTTDADWTIRHETYRERYDRALEGLRKRDVPSIVRAMYTRIFFPDRVGDFEETRGTANAVLGLPAEDLDEATKTGVDRGLAGVL